MDEPRCTSPDTCFCTGRPGCVGLGGCEFCADPECLGECNAAGEDYLPWPPGVVTEWGLQDEGLL